MRLLHSGRNVGHAHSRGRSVIVPDSAPWARSTRSAAVAVLQLVLAVESVFSQLFQPSVKEHSSFHLNSHWGTFVALLEAYMGIEEGGRAIKAVIYIYR